MSQRPPEEPQEPLPEDHLPDETQDEEQLPDAETPEPDAEIPEEEIAEEEFLDDEEYLDDEDERLSGTLLGSLHQATQGMGSYGTALFGGGVFAIIVGGAVYLLIGDLRLYASIILGIGAGLLLLGIITSWPSVRTSLGARRGRYGVNSVVMVTAFLGIAAVGAFLAFENVARFDVTATNQFSLATRTKNLLSDLDHQIEATAFFVEEEASQQAALTTVENTLREFDARSSNFSYRVVDPDREPETARNLGVAQYGVIVFQDTVTERVHVVAPPLGARTLQQAYGFLEQDFVTALLIVTGQEQKNVYFLTGHQERSIADAEAESDGYGIASSLGLRGENYSVDEFSLLGREARVPEDATLVVIAGPKRDFFAIGENSEIQALDDYLEGGGRLLVLLDPEDRVPGDEGMKDFRDFLARWGIEVLPGHIVDRESWDEAGGAHSSSAIASSMVGST